MKKIFMMCLFFSFAVVLLGQVTDAESVKLSWHTIVAFIAGIYEVIVRLIPTVKNYSWVGKIIEILQWLSNFLNLRKKKIAGITSGAVGTFVKGTEFKDKKG